MNLETDRDKIDLVLDKLYNMNSQEDGTESVKKDASKNCAGAALKASVDLLSQTKGGRIALFSGTIC